MLKILNRSKNKKGFTLIELIVVIAILAILAAILVPTMLGVIGDSRQQVADSNAHTLFSTAQAAYVSLVANGTTIPDDDYDQDNTHAFITEVKENAGNILGDENFTIVVNAEGVVGVVLGTGAYPTGYTVPGGAG